MREFITCSFSYTLITDTLFLQSPPPISISSPLLHPPKNYALFQIINDSLFSLAYSCSAELKFLHTTEYVFCCIKFSDVK